MKANHRTTRLILYLILALATNVNSQSINALTFGNSGITQFGVGGTKLTNSDIIVAGYAETTPGSSDFSLSKLGSTGQLKWTIYSGTPNNDLASMMFYDGGNRIYICGTTYSTQNFNSGLVICFDTLGNTIWQQIYSLPNSSISLTGIECMSNGIMLVGNYSIPSNIGNDIIMLMTDRLGALQHYHLFGDPAINEIANGMTMAGDTLAIIACDKFVGNTGYNAYVLACDTNGTQVWESTLTSRFNSGSKNVMLDNFNSIIVVGETETDSSTQYDIQISKLDLFGNILWMNSIKGSNYSDAGFSVCNSLNGNYILTGFYFDTISNSKRMMLLETDTSGSLNYIQLYGSSAASIGMSVTSFGSSYLVVGSDLINGLYQILYDTLMNSNSILESESNSGLIIYPNPAIDLITIQTSKLNNNHITGIELFDLTGNIKSFYKFFDKIDSNTFEIPLNPNAGLIFLRVHFSKSPPIVKQIVQVK